MDQADLVLIRRLILHILCRIMTIGDMTPFIIVMWHWDGMRIMVAIVQLMLTVLYDFGSGRDSNNLCLLGLAINDCFLILNSFLRFSARLL